MQLKPHVGSLDLQKKLDKELRKAYYRNHIPENYPAFKPCGDKGP